ncbi:unnamed protein product [Cercopithifilaria johnstoni]|uniref:Uncharacterized protein n=1 Tax=Cercopithifilaria johnstoni TaxID=2874296 RepID=A0A8J2MHQ6_9BILA|nr:unnamed protein product [Cercopithifilaria johnstoni]
MIQFNPFQDTKHVGIPLQTENLEPGLSGPDGLDGEGAPGPQGMVGPRGVQGSFEDQGERGLKEIQGPPAEHGPLGSGK